MRAALLLALALLAGCGASAPADDGTASVERPPNAGPASVPGVELPPYGPIDYQLGGPYEPAPETKIVTRDHTVDSAPGTYGVCYVNAFQTQPEDRGFWDAEHPDLLLTNDGRVVEDENWPGELILDTSSSEQRAELTTVLRGWVDECAARGYEAVEPDNLDSYDRSEGALSEADNLAVTRELASYAHGRGLAIAQKNASELGTRGRDAGLDFAVSEDCQQYDECEVYTDLYPRLLEIEYDEGAFAEACEERGGTTAVLLRDPDVVPAGTEGYVSRTC